MSRRIDANFAFTVQRQRIPPRFHLGDRLVLAALQRTNIGHARPESKASVLKPRRSTVGARFSAG